MSNQISGLNARMILDSRGNPTVEVDCYVDGILTGRAAVPSGASTGAYEALEMRDGDSSKYLGKGVSQAVENITQRIEEALVGLPVDEQKIIEMGSHEELIKKKGSYFQMYETWEKQEEEKREEIL